MKKTTLKVFLMMLIVASASTTVSAQKLIYGNSISLMAPTGDFGDVYKGGFGINANFEASFSKIGVLGEFGYSTFAGDDDIIQVDDLSTWNLLVGAKLSLIGPLYIEGRTGYYFGDVDEFVIIPAAGVRFKKFDINAGYQAAGDFNFMNFRVGYFWGGSD